MVIIGYFLFWVVFTHCMSCRSPVWFICDTFTFKLDGSSLGLGLPFFWGVKGNLVRSKFSKTLEIFILALFCRVVDIWRHLTWARLSLTYRCPCLKISAKQSYKHEWHILVGYKLIVGMYQVFRIRCRGFLQNIGCNNSNPKVRT